MTNRPSPFRADLLDDKVAMVAGGATGLGLEIARVFGNHGARVAICSRKEANLRAAVTALREAGIEHLHGALLSQGPREEFATEVTRVSAPAGLSLPASARQPRAAPLF